MVKCSVPTEFDIRALPEFKEKLEELSGGDVVEIDLTDIESIDAAAGQFLLSLEKSNLSQPDKYIFKGFSNGSVQKAMDQICLSFQE